MSLLELCFIGLLAYVAVEIIILPIQALLRRKDTGYRWITLLIAIILIGVVGFILAVQGEPAVTP